MEVAAENIDMKLDEAFPDDDELKEIRDYFTREKQGETDFISLQDAYGECRLFIGI